MVHIHLILHHRYARSERPSIAFRRSKFVRPTRTLAHAVMTRTIDPLTGVAEKMGFNGYLLKTLVTRATT